jgi:hypothetical protein
VDKSTIMLLDLGHKDPSESPLCIMSHAGLFRRRAMYWHSGSRYAETRTILTLPEVREELWRSIFQGEARKALLEGGARIGAF